MQATGPINLTFATSRSLPCGLEVLHLANVNSRLHLTCDKVRTNRQNPCAIVENLMELKRGQLVPIAVEESDRLKGRVLVHRLSKVLQRLSAESIVVQVHMLENAVAGQCFSQRLGQQPHAQACGPE